LLVDTLLDPHGPREHIVQARLGISQAWAAKLLTVGVPAGLPLEYDRVTGAVVHTLGQLAAAPAGTAWESFHFALNDTVVGDNRIPPYRMDFDEALKRNLLPVPQDQFGDPGPGESYEHWVDVPLEPPAGAVRADLALLYQPTSWEYVQFLVLANDGSIPFLAQEGQNLLNAWLATAMASPITMASETWDAGCNPNIQEYCQAKVSSTGCTPQIGTTGMPSLSGPDDFHARATQIPGQTTGLLMWGYGPNPPGAGSTGIPGLLHPSPRGGLLCVSQAHLWGGLTSAGAAGSCNGVLDAHLTESFFAANGIASGTQLYIQFWYADPAHPDGSGLGHTAALRFTLCP
jgi:hypothetical protein